MLILEDYIQISRLNRPIGIWLLLFPAFAGLSMNLNNVKGVYWIVFFIGAIVMRSAGCVYNDLVDRAFDGKVRRTRLRPLVRPKNPMSHRSAYLFLGMLLLIGLACLLTLNLFAIGIGVMAALMIALYPWMKRITYWPQLFLGFTMNIGFLIGAVAVVGASFEKDVIFLYIGMVFWTLGYDTIYGFQDMEDDILIGVKSSSLKIRSYPRVFVGFCYLSALLLWGGGGVFSNGKGLSLLIGLLIFWFFSWQVVTLDIRSAENCLERFKVNQWVSMLLFLMVITLNRGS